MIDAVTGLDLDVANGRAVTADDALIGVLSGREGESNPHDLMLKNAGLREVFVGSRSMFEDRSRAIAVNRMEPVVDKVFGFDEVTEAFDYQWNRKHFGKVVIRIAD